VTEKYSDQLLDWLVELGYTDCFFVAGGNIMHLLDSARSRVRCVPFVHEVAAGIAVEYFNEAAPPDRRAFALVTAGPGLTNIVTALGGAYLESRELLVVGGQAKSTDLAHGLRQRGIQEIDGLSIARPLCVAAERIEQPVEREVFESLVCRGQSPRKGPVFIEVCLDAQGAPLPEPAARTAAVGAAPGPQAGPGVVAEIVELTRSAARPVWLIGGGVDRAVARELLPALERAGVPLMTTWNGLDRVPADHPLYLGRPNTWGQRAANILLQQADLIVALGTRLGLQQTGFNWQQFAPVGKVVQVDVDDAELSKGHPRVDVPVHGDANEVLRALADAEYPAFEEWLAFGREVKELLPVDDSANETGAGFISPYAFSLELSELLTGDDIFIPCSSGGANSVPMQAFRQKAGQVVISDHGLAAMGYGLGGAIGASLAYPGRRVVLVEGDGGFAQNLQELGTVSVNSLPLKIFIFDNDGYSSIRTTQRNYFGGEYIGCDSATGLGFPEWEPLFASFGIPSMRLEAGDWTADAELQRRLAAPGPAAFIVPIDPEQTYWPKIASRITESGSMESNPLHLMTPELPPEIAQRVFVHLDPG
jgi:acetolactate synthase-1/2/3 large subunit